VTRIATPSMGEPILIEGYEPQAVYEIFGYDPETEQWLVNVESEAILTISMIEPTPEGIAQWKGEAPLWVMPSYDMAEILAGEEKVEGPDADSVIQAWLRGEL
jgi:hypothetical protein